MKKTQLSFEYFEIKKHKKKYNRTAHGGTESKGKRKEFRPLSTKHTIHLVLKSDKARGQFSFLTHKNKPLVDTLLKSKAKKFGVRIAEYVNVGNHLHIKIRISSREAFQKFLKSITTLIARKITGAKKGKRFGRFWQGLAFTRVLRSAFEELQLKGYFEANRRQASHSYRERDLFLTEFNLWVQKLKTDIGDSSC